MTSAELIPATLLKRKAVIYVRQSTQSQVMTNLESQRRQYDLADVARQRGFVDIEVIDSKPGSRICINSPRVESLAEVARGDRRTKMHPICRPRQESRQACLNSNLYDTI